MIRFEIVSTVKVLFKQVVLLLCCDQSYKDSMTENYYSSAVFVAQQWLPIPEDLGLNTFSCFRDSLIKLRIQSLTLCILLSLQLQSRKCQIRSVYKIDLKSGIQQIQLNRLKENYLRIRILGLGLWDKDFRKRILVQRCQDKQCRKRAEKRIV